MLKIAVRNWLRPLAADTGRVREVTITDQLGAHCHRGHPGGHWPQMLKRNLQIPLAFFRGLGYIIGVLALRCFEC